MRDFSLFGIKIWKFREKLVYLRTKIVRFVKKKLTPQIVCGEKRYLCSDKRDKKHHYNRENMALTVTYKGYEIRVSHNLKDQTDGLLEINRLGNTIYAYTNSTLSTHEVICVIESHWSEICRELALCHSNQYLTGIISPQDIPHKKITSTIKHVATGFTTLEGVVSRYYGWHRHGRVICDNCGCSVNDYLRYEVWIL